MSIWVYNDSTDPEHLYELSQAAKCVYCDSALLALPLEESEIEGQPIHVSPWGELPTFTRRERNVSVCPTCGWWKLQEHIDSGTPVQWSRSHFAAAGSLLEMEALDHSIAIEEVRSFLAARYESRFKVDPKVWEEVVASVYSGIGYEASVVGRSYDDGIDVVLVGPNDQITGVQVKRYQDSIRVDQIRSFAGALLLNGLTKGVFVTTSRFTPAARKTAEKFGARGMSIQLVDAKGFFDSLGFVQRSMYQTNHDPDAPFLKCVVSPLYLDGEAMFGEP